MHSAYRHNAKPAGRRGQGFTLLELCVVVFLIGLIGAIAFPRLLPVIAFSKLEGGARHLANYGRSAIAHVTLRREPITVRFDLDAQEYYAVHWIHPEEGEGEGEVEDQLEKLAQMRVSSDYSAKDLSSMLAGERLEDGSYGELPEDFDQEQADAQMNDRFARFARRATEARAENVIHDEGIVSEIGPLFEKEFELDADEPIEEELFDPILQRVRLKDGDEEDPDVWLEAVVIDGTANTGGVVEVELSPLGLTQKIGFYVTNADRHYYTVVWDPVTGGVDVLEGKEDIS